ncbi:MAG: glycosyltransferase family 2 protein [Bacteroidota bacterium]|nr:glycosyltransferase family 2 protein [Bacteroidota bacterium]
MLSIILPCYNEQDNLEFLFNSLDPVAAAHQDLEIILVNNGSTDNSVAVFEQELAKRNRNIFRVVTVEKNIGYGYGILTGLRAAKGDILSVTHADRQTDPMDVLKAFKIYQDQSSTLALVKGFRKNRRPMEAFFSWGMGLLSSLALGTRLTEINAQPKLFSKAFFDSIEQDAPHDFSLDLYFLYHAKNKGQIIDFPVYFAKRVAGEAKGGSGSSWKVRWKLIKRILNYIFELRKKVKQ